MDRRNGSFDDEEDDAELVADGAALRPFSPFRPASAAVAVEFGSHSHPGRRRISNDDHFLIVRFGRTHDIVATSLPEDALPREFAESAFGAIVADGIGPNGPDVASRLAVSALSRPQEKEAALHAGCDAYLAKPFTPDEMARQIASTLESQGVGSR